MKVAVAVAALALAFPASAYAGASHTARVRAVHQYRTDTGRRATTSNSTCKTQTNWKTWYCKVRVQRGHVVGFYSISVSKRTSKARVTSLQYTT